MKLVLLLPLGAALILGVGSVNAQPATPMKNMSGNGTHTGASIGTWKLEVLELTSGRKLEGYVSSSDDRGVDFVEVRRPPGRPMYLIARRWPKSQVRSTQQLPAPERQQLAERIEQFSNRRLIEAEELAAINLVSFTRDGQPAWRYQNDGLTVESTTDADTTRRAVMRLEHVLAAYQEVLPPRNTTPRPLTLLLFGNMADYRRQCQALGIHVANPSIYLPDKNLLLAGSDLGDYQRQLEQVRDRQQSLRNEMQAQAAKMRILLDEIAADLTARKIPPADKKKLLAAARAKLEQQLADLERRVDLAEKQNQTQFDKATHDMFARLTHEAFHAYLENEVFPQQQFAVPRWLNEGLAQLFEEGQLDVGTLRLDTPGKERLEKLATDLRGAAPLPLADLLAARPEKFLVGHGEAGETSDRHYLYSWGLAYFLAFEANALNRPELETYVRGESSADNRAQPIARFESFVGQPLPQFERQWRAAMVELARTSGTIAP